ncbi:MAG: DUF2382 domain-containing protein [Gaiellaceae bacterium]
MVASPSRNARLEGTGPDATLVRSEEELVVGTEQYTRGTLRARKHVDVDHFDQSFERDVERLDDVERVEAPDGDSGEIETLPDGSVSIPVFEERLVVTKQVVVRERVIIRKKTETEQERVQADLRRERVEVEEET